ncbi:hypothetical protein [Mesorhizobium sp. CAU 1732]|uniref:hypothetical protein n=1 Tax=Mesorhizobium sp. CAU 1732 TaxID=3140358 RepID=UPI003261787D
MTDFARLASLARLTVDAVHGGAVRLQPKERGKGPHGAVVNSTTRQAAIITVAFFSDTDFAARKRAMPTIGQAGERMLNRSPETFASTAFAGEIATGDHIVKLDPVTQQPTGKAYEVVSRDPDDIGNVILGLVHIHG